MIHKKCGTEISDDKLFRDIHGYSVKIRGRCPTCKQVVQLDGYRMDDNEYKAAYHGVSGKWFDLAKRFNHSAWGYQ